MQRLERLVVHVEEAMRLGSMGDEAHLRLALLMLDSAAELMLHHWTTWPLHEAASYSRMLPMCEKMHEATGTGAEDLVEIRAKALSSTRRRKIEREFGAKCDYLRDRGQLSDAQVRVLRRLHEYRNEAYHQDHLRPSTLASAVKIYTYDARLILGRLNEDLETVLDYLVGLEDELGYVVLIEDEGVLDLVGTRHRRRLPAAALAVLEGK